MAQAAEAALQEGRQALSRLAWHDAYRHLAEADRDGALSAADLEGLGYAAWWTGHPSEALDYRERAFAGYVEGGDVRSAARVAVWLANVHQDRNSKTVAAGWLRQAEDLLRGLDEGPESAWLLVTKAYLAVVSGGVEEALALAGEAQAVGERVGPPAAHYASLARHMQGRIKVMQGDMEAGLKMMDEAIAPALGGSMEPYAMGLLYCSTIGACKELGDFQRAAEWTRQAEKWCEKLSVSGFPGVCRVHRAEILRFGGEWPRAEQEARKACDELEGYFAEVIALGQYEIGEVRRRMGDFAQAEEAFMKAHQAGHDPQPGLALLRLAQGRTGSAFSSIKRALADFAPPLMRLPLLPAAIEIALAAGDAAYAEDAVRELEGIAAKYRTTSMEAEAVRGRALFDLQTGNPDGAQSSLRRARRLWAGLANPYEAARTQVQLGLAYRAAGDEEAAALEFRGALGAFETLGAAPDARAAAELAGSPGSQGPRGLTTFMFTDIVDSTRILEVMGDEAWEHQLAWHDRILRAAFEAHSGTEIKKTGDGFFVVFDSAGEAAAAAAEIQRRLDAHRKEHGFAPRVRIGLHSGEATLQDGDYQGRAVHEAARIGALAGAGEIAASLSSVSGVDGLKLSEPRTAAVKGLSQPLEIVSVDWR